MKNAWLSFTLLPCSKASHVVLLYTFGDFRAAVNDYLETLLIKNASFVIQFPVSFMKLIKRWLTLICEKEMQYIFVDSFPHVGMRAHPCP